MEATSRHLILEPLVEKHLGMYYPPLDCLDTPGCACGFPCWLRAVASVIQRPVQEWLLLCEFDFWQRLGTSPGVPQALRYVIQNTEFCATVCSIDSTCQLNCPWEHTTEVRPPTSQPHMLLAGHEPSMVTPRQVPGASQPPLCATNAQGCQ